jgi:hypothetical protein
MERVNPGIQGSIRRVSRAVEIALTRRDRTVAALDAVTTGDRGGLVPLVGPRRVWAIGPRGSGLAANQWTDDG